MCTKLCFMNLFCHKQLRETGSSTQPLHIRGLKLMACDVYKIVKVVVGHIFETSIKCFFFIQTQWNFVYMFFKAVRTTFYQF